jgi:glutamyl-tRNA reductase
MAEPFGGRVVPIDQLYEAASQADIVITSTSAPHPIFGREHGQAFLHRRRNRPMFFIDLAVPRDVDPAMGKLEGIFVYDIDDLEQVAAAHRSERSREASDAETLIAAEVERFQQRQRTVNVARPCATWFAQRGTSSGRRGVDSGNGQQISSSAHAGPQASRPRRRSEPH